jgi:hypothetical protein
MAWLSDDSMALTARNVVLHFFMKYIACSWHFKSFRPDEVPKNFLVEGKYRRSERLQYMLVTWECAQ